MTYSVPMNIQETINIARLRAKLEGRDMAVAIFTRTDGGQVALSDVNVNSISPSGANRGCIAVEFDNDVDKIVHLPFIESWQIEWVS